MSSFLKNIQNTAHRFDLWKRGDTILVAVSGGPDSLCLLDCLFCLSKKYEWSLHIAHVNYALRGVDSDADEALVRERAEFYTLPLSTLHPKKLQKTNNLEARLRDIRYDFFEKTRRTLGFNSIAVAHNQDDQAETLLLRLIRGSGLRGLGAMRPKDGVIIRPLLLTSRNEILEYLSEKQLPFRLDASNSDPAFTRNRVRHELLPFLESFNPNIRETLSNAALSLADDADLLALLLAPSLSKESDSQRFSLDVDAFCVLHPALQRSILRHIAEVSGHYEQPPSFGEIDEMRAFLMSSKNKAAYKTFRGLKFTRRGARVSVLV